MLRVSGFRGSGFGVFGRVLVYGFSASGLDAVDYGGSVV